MQNNSDSTDKNISVLKNHCEMQVIVGSYSFGIGKVLEFYR